MSHLEVTVGFVSNSPVGFLQQPVQVTSANHSDTDQGDSKGFTCTEWEIKAVVVSVTKMHTFTPEFTRRSLSPKFWFAAWKWEVCYCLVRYLEVDPPEHVLTHVRLHSWNKLIRHIPTVLWSSPVFIHVLTKTAKISVYTAKHKVENPCPLIFSWVPLIFQMG